MVNACDFGHTNPPPVAILTSYCNPAVQQEANMVSKLFAAAAAVLMAFVAVGGSVAVMDDAAYAEFVA